MSQLLGTIAILGFLVCIVMIIVSAVRRSGKVKKWAIGTGICFVLFIIALNIPSTPSTSVSTKAGQLISSSDKELLKKSYSSFDDKQRTQFSEIEEKYKKLSDTEKEEVKVDFERISKERDEQVTKWQEEKRQQYEEAAAQTAKAIENLKNEAKSIPYKDLARNPKDYIGKKVKYTGEVIQVQESGIQIALRVNVTKNDYGYEDTIYVNYILGSKEGRILEKDIISIWGTAMDLMTYETVMGAEVTIPQVNAQIIEVKK